MAISKYYSYSQSRLVSKNADLERLFEKAWKQECRNSTFLTQVLLKKKETGDLIDAGISQAEARATTSAIRWLGTSVGFNWLKATLGKQNITIRETKPVYPHIISLIESKFAWDLNECDFIRLFDHIEYPSLQELLSRAELAALPARLLPKLIRQRFVVRVKLPNGKQHFYRTEEGTILVRRFHVRNVLKNISTYGELFPSLEL